MKKPWTVQCGYMAHFANTVTVEAASLEEALEKAIETANDDDAWRSTDHCGPTFVDAVCEGADADPWCEGTLSVPERFSCRHVTATGSTDRADGAPGIEIREGSARIRVADA